MNNTKKIVTLCYCVTLSIILQNDALVYSANKWDVITDTVFCSFMCFSWKWIGNEQRSLHDLSQTFCSSVMDAFHSNELCHPKKLWRGKTKRREWWWPTFSSQSVTSIFSTFEGRWTNSKEVVVRFVWS